MKLKSIGKNVKNDLTASLHIRPFFPDFLYFILLLFPAQLMQMSFQIHMRKILLAKCFIQNNGN